MIIRVHHRHHYEWVVPEPGDTIGAGEPTVPVDDRTPHVVRVQRMHESGNGQHTTVDIPDEEAIRMAREWAWKEMPRAQREIGVAPTITRRHLHNAISRHLYDIVHEDHAPVEHWHDIEVEGDSVLERHLRIVHLESERGSVET